MAFKMNTGFLSFKIKAISKEPKEKSRSSHPSLTSGVIVKQGDEYLVKIMIDGEENFYNLTDKSFNIYDRRVLYSRKEGKHGYTAVIKTANDAKLVNGISSIYLPFKPNSKVKGKLVKADNNTKVFDLVEVLYPENYVTF